VYEGPGNQGLHQSSMGSGIHTINIRLQGIGMPASSNQLLAACGFLDPLTNLGQHLHLIFVHVPLINLSGKTCVCISIIFWSTKWTTQVFNETRR